MNEQLLLLRRRRVALFTAVLVVAFLLPTIESSTDHGLEFISQKRSSGSAQNKPLSFTHRKLLDHGKEEANENEKNVEPSRIWSDKCSMSDIVISQGATEPLPNGIPTYTVEIMNVCVSGCGIYGVHLRCGWFSSARLVNPRVFKRLHFDDCLVNDGKPLVNGRTLSFQYANTFPYSLSVSSVSC